MPTPISRYAPFPAFTWINDPHAFTTKLASKKWFTPDTYGNDFADIPDGPAVYLFFVYDRNECYRRAFVAYVGMAKRLVIRLRQHEVLFELNRHERFWPQRWFLPTSIPQLRSRETSYIHCFDPPWNIMGRRRGMEVVS